MIKPHLNDPNLLEELRTKLLQIDQSNESEIRKWFRNKLGLKKSQGNEWYKRAKEMLENPDSPIVIDDNEDNVIMSSTSDDEIIFDCRLKGQSQRRSFGNYEDVKTIDAVKGNRQFILPPTESQIRTLDQLLDAAGVDLTRFEIIDHLINKWDMSCRINDDIVTTPQFQVKCRLRPIKQIVETEQILEIFRENLKKNSPTWNVIIPKKNDGKYMLELGIPDIHIGKLAWKEETRFENYNATAACEIYRQALEDLLAKAPLGYVEKILFPVGNDFFNVDSMANETTAGTPQAEDSRWQDTFRKGSQLISKAIETLATIAPVEVLFVAGNHDVQRTFYLGEVIDAYFRTHELVAVDNAPTVRKYCKYGTNLIGFDHGKDIKPQDLPLTMAVEQKQHWGETKFKEIHVGHLHKEMDNEYKGVKVRFLPSLCATDAWHSSKSYIGTTRTAKSFLYHKQKGLEAQYYFNL